MWQTGYSSMIPNMRNLKSPATRYHQASTRHQHIKINNHTYKQAKTQTTKTRHKVCEGTNQTEHQHTLCLPRQRAGAAARRTRPSARARAPFSQGYEHGLLAPHTWQVTSCPVSPKTQQNHPFFFYLQTLTHQIH